MDIVLSQFSQILANEKAVAVRHSSRPPVADKRTLPFLRSAPARSARTEKRQL